MDLDWLEDFVALAEGANFSRAAEARNVSQPAFSRRIKALEDWVGTGLVDRDTHRITLTEAGLTFLAVAQDAVRRLSLGRDAAREVALGQTNLLRFAATHALSVTYFPTWLRACDNEGTYGSISLIADNMAACERLMLEGRADFLLCHHHASEKNRLSPDSFHSMKLGSDVLLPVCVPVDGHPRFALPGTPGHTLPYLEFDEQSGMGRILGATGIVTRNTAALRTVFRSHLATALLHMAREGRGIAWVPQSLCIDDLRTGRLIKAGDDRWSIPIDIFIFRPRVRQTAAVEKFWSRIIQSDQTDGPQS